MKRKIVFLTGTRADFGKLKPLMQAVDASPLYHCSIFVTGMHLISRYGLTVDEIHKVGFRDIYTFMNQIHGEPMELVLANTISGLSRYFHEYKPDMIVVHGDRLEALAGAIVGALRNVLVAHIEGGEVSGAVDELIRHSVTKLSHIHFVANNAASERLRQLGEDSRRIYIIGSPDIDILLSKNLPSLKAVKERYDITFDTYGIVLFHSVTTELKEQHHRAKELVSALMESEHNYIVIYPNNDEGCEDIFTAYRRLEGNSRFRVFPSLRFEYFLTLLRNARFIIGNSSAGIREAPVFAVPTVNIGNRQLNRFHHVSILNVGHDREEILAGISKIKEMTHLKPCHHFGDGNSVDRFVAALRNDDLWQTPKQKQFCDMIWKTDNEIMDKV